jgi:hypothetical protein
MSELLSLVGAITAGFYFIMLLTPALAARKLKTSHAWWIFWAGLLSGTVSLVFLSYLKMWVVFFTWVGLMVWAGFDVQIGRGEANRLNSLR